MGGGVGGPAGVRNRAWGAAGEVQQAFRQVAAWRPCRWAGGLLHYTPHCQAHRVVAGGHGWAPSLCSPVIHIPQSFNIPAYMSLSPQITSNTSPPPPPPEPFENRLQTVSLNTLCVFLKNKDAFLRSHHILSGNERLHHIPPNPLVPFTFCHLSQ